MTVLIAGAAPIRGCSLYHRHVPSITRPISTASLLNRCYYHPILQTKKLRFTEGKVRQPECSLVRVFISGSRRGPMTPTGGSGLCSGQVPWVSCQPWRVGGWQRRALTPFSEAPTPSLWSWSSSYLCAHTSGQTQVSGLSVGPPHPPPGLPQCHLPRLLRFLGLEGRP